jgi:hypothetical protein
MLNAAADEMATLNDKDRRWLSDQIDSKVDVALRGNPLLAEKIASVLDSFKPQGWTIARERILSFGSPAAICSVILAMFTITCGALYQSFAHVKEETQFRTDALHRLTDIEKSLLSLRAGQAASTPTRLQSQSEAMAIIATAKDKAIRLPENVVAETGISFIQAAASNEKAWEVALEFANYRSTLNSIPPNNNTHPIEQQTPRRGETRYQVRSVVIDGVKQQQPGFFYRLDNNNKMRPQSEAARVEQIETPQHQEAEFGVPAFVLRGGFLPLDGMRLRHVVLDGVTVYYAGGPMILRNVVFVRCRFMLDNTPNSRTAAQQILASSEVNVSIGSELAVLRRPFSK